ncbi:T-cell immunoglobulin and mucin domain-containing protein 4-like isoform X2 [Oncorhynchus tshawytscha]|uniref:T-cell immunoglobulin and mucin domain-containing protein 4-like isoform X2 n=1 Tax=Oncorhynchus tshawytscha TaxID=74940 RepID=UPI001C3D5978|nr:T-cell immunoglobulin and mucin domain-containing protein 4-like isoform X2 [Oncorhynchus tshawytscha]
METPCVLGWFLLCLLSVSECIDPKVIGIEGQNVTLPCKYNTIKQGVLAICWGRGAIPNSGCNKEIISSDGTKVTWRSSVRYNLFGVLKTGDVSLTILNVTEKDSGQYGCRVHVYGLWNDEKYHVNLNIEKGADDRSACDPGVHSTGSDRGGDCVCTCRLEKAMENNCYGSPNQLSSQLSSQLHQHNYCPSTDTPFVCHCL